MTVVGLLASLVVFLVLAMTVAWRVAVSTGKSGWVDAIWSFAVGFAGVAAALAPLGGGALASRQLIVASLVALWSLRLGLHIAARTRTGGDDPRYAELRREWGGDFERRLFWFLQVQAACAFVLAVTVLAAAHNPAPVLRPADWLGIAILGVAIAGEALADRQLRDFTRDPANRGAVCDTGLWSWSRHPNYFFEWLGWIAYPVVAVDLAGGYAWGWAALAGPVLMYWLLVHVSGIPPLEKHMVRSRGDRFRAYQARVNAFWPWPGKSSAGNREQET